jgi:hypothetical protein
VGGQVGRHYPRFSQQYIASAYPAPAQYHPEEAEADEMLLWDESLAEAPFEELPCQLLTDFCIYDAEVGGSWVYRGERGVRGCRGGGTGAAGRLGGRPGTASHPDQA